MTQLKDKIKLAKKEFKLVKKDLDLFNYNIKNKTYVENYEAVKLFLTDWTFKKSYLSNYANDNNIISDQLKNYSEQKYNLKLREFDFIASDLYFNTAIKDNREDVLNEKLDYFLNKIEEFKDKERTNKFLTMLNNQYGWDLQLGAK